MNEQYNETDSKVKATTALFAKLIDYVIREISMRKRIAGRSGLNCSHEGTYYSEDDPEQQIYLKVGDPFPPVIRYGSMTQGVWVLRYEDRPHKKWHEFGYVYLTIVVIATTIYLIRLALVAPTP